MNNKNVRIIYKRINEKFKNKGYINLNHMLVNTKDDLIEISTIFRNPMYETFRIIYMKDNKIIGNEAISSKIPTKTYVFPKSKTGTTRAERSFYKIKNRMERLNANGYYMVHNHPSGNIKASRCDLRTTQYFAEKIKGFKGHLIVNEYSYAWIDINEKGFAVEESYLPIKQNKVNKTNKKLNKKSIYDVKINNREDLVYLMHHIKNHKDYSTAILTDCIGQVRMILDIPNRIINIPKEQLKGYFRNLAKINGIDRVFFATTDNEIYNKSLKHLEYGTFTDSICYKEENKKIYVYEAKNIKPKSTLFEDLKEGELKVEDKKEEYKLNKELKEETELNIIDTNKKEEKPKLRVLYKEVGKRPVIKLIEDTLEAKQKLVGGLIEVVYYNDNTLLVCNDEGKNLNMLPNLVFDYDYIAGNCFLVGDDYERGGFRSLKMSEIQKLKKEINQISFNYKQTKPKKKTFNDFIDR